MVVVVVVVEVVVVVVEVLVVVVEVLVVVVVVVLGVSKPKRFMIHSPPHLEFGSPGHDILHPP